MVSVSLWVWISIRGPVTIHGDRRVGKCSERGITGITGEQRIEPID